MPIDLRVPKDVERWLDLGRDDVEMFAYKGLGIEINAKQAEFAHALLERRYMYYNLDWANRAGKTTILAITHQHQIWYKPWLVVESHTEWLQTEYSTLHCAPLGELAGRAWTALQEMSRGMHPAQRDRDTGVRRDAPLAPLFSAAKVRDPNGSDKMALVCVTGGKTDFRSTEGLAARLESGAWRLITWDEWPATEGDPEDVRFIADVRLPNRAADFDAPIVLTGTRTPDTEHIAREFDDKAQDPANVDWWGSHASRMDNPTHSALAIERARRNMDVEDFNRTILGVEGGSKGRIFPTFLVEKMFDNALPRFTAPVAGDGYRPAFPDESPWTYLHLWDLAIAAADNIGIVLRAPKNWDFDLENPLVGCRLVVVPGSRTLTDAEIVHTIEETFLPYGGQIVVDATDAHGKNIHRELRSAGYPVEGFDFHARVPPRSMLRKDRGILRLRAIMADGLELEYGAEGELVMDEDEVATLDLSMPFGAISLPREWKKVRDQVSLLRKDDKKQKKDAVMSLVQGGDIAYGRRNSARRPTKAEPFVVFAETA
jgi:hypothetical protein